MNMLRRLLLCLWSLVLIADAAVVGVCAFRQDVAQYWLNRLEPLLLSGRYFWWLLLAGVLMLVVGMLGVFVALARKAQPAEVVVGMSEGGQVNVSLVAVDNVVRKAAQGISGVKEVQPHLKSTGASVDIGLEIVIAHDVNVPETAAAVQEAVKSQLQTITGLTITEVKVLVSSVANKTIQ